MFSPFQYAFVQRGLLEMVLLAAPAGILGVWIVLRGLAFYSHGVGTAAFPGLVLADGLGFAPTLGAFGAALVFAFGVERFRGRSYAGHDTATALVLVGALSCGIILASDVFHSGAHVESLLFGSLLLVQDRDFVFALAASALACLCTIVLGARWLAVGFDERHARAIGLRSSFPDAALLVLVAFSVVAALTAVGALLVTALFVVPAATTRLFTRRIVTWQIASVVLVALEGVAGIWISVEMNVPPGAALAVLSGGVFAVALLIRALPRLAVVAAAIMLLAGCGGGGGNDSKLHAVATTTQIGDWVRIVGGNAVDVHQILEPNTDPHEYEPRPGDVTATAGAKVVFENGDNLDQWMNDVVSQAGGHARVVVLGEHVPVKLPGESSGREASRYDPHWWHDPRNAEAAVKAIREALVSAAPAERATFEQNSARYLRSLRRLDRTINRCIAQIPRSERKLVTDHDAFGYLARRYGLTIVGAVIPSQTTQAQPSAGEIANLIELVRREHVKAVFPESSLNARLAQTIARETGATSDHTLYGDTLGPRDSNGATYLTMERSNADSIVRGLSSGRIGCGE
jgi:zinc/manganese transport system substrate-binding protein